MTEEKKPEEKTEIERVEAYKQMDVRDENQIIAEMKGELALIEEYVYSFKQSGKQITSLSYAGVKEMVRRRGNFEILDAKIEETDKTIRALVKIRDLANRVDFLGASETEKDKAFAYVLTVNKAERNAYMKAMPAKLLAKMVDAFLHGEKTEEQPQSQSAIVPKGVDPVNFVREKFPPELEAELEFTQIGNDVMVKPKKFLGGDVFREVSEFVKSMDGEYISADKNSHFRIPVQQEAAKK